MENEIRMYVHETRHVKHEGGGNNDNEEQYFQFVKTCYLYYFCIYSRKPHQKPLKPSRLIITSLYFKCELTIANLCVPLCTNNIVITRVFTFFW